jgi:biopolymer transport protein ExbD
MNLWSVRHQGSPQSVDGQTSEDVLDGVREGIWEPSDEIMGPGDGDWQALEHHPVFAQAMADYEPPPPKVHPDETKLDMNPLIDVALVLLIFFILTTTYEELRKEFKPPEAERESKQGVSDSELKKVTIRVTAKLENGEPVYRVEGEVVAERELENKFKQLRDSLGHDKLAMEIDPQVPWKAVVAIQDAASGAKFSEIIRVVRPPRE